MNVWLGWLGAQWLALSTALLTGVLLTEAFLGHYRSGFAVRMQYSPFIVGSALLAGLASAIVAPRSGWTLIALRAAGWLSIALSIVGVGFHYYYGIIEKPGGHRWLLHHLMYHAPLLAPLGLTVAGAMALVTAGSLGGSSAFFGLESSRASALVVAFALAGTMLQVAVLHYRGAFNNPVMFAPLILPLVSIAGAAWYVATASGGAERLYLVGLWITFFTGFVGWGMHLRGLDRMMGGLYVAVPNVLEGPPPLAPLLFALLSLQGLVGVTLL